METLKQQLEKFKIPAQSKITSERQLILQDFLDRLNAERGKFPPISPSRLGVMLSVCTNSQLRQFYGDCNYARSFSKFFWWKIKQAKLSTA